MKSTTSQKASASLVSHSKHCSVANGMLKPMPTNQCPILTSQRNLIFGTINHTLMQPRTTTTIGNGPINCHIHNHHSLQHAIIIPCIPKNNNKIERQMLDLQEMTGSSKADIAANKEIHNGEQKTWISEEESQNQSGIPSTVSQQKQTWSQNDSPTIHDTNHDHNDWDAPRMGTFEATTLHRQADTSIRKKAKMLSNFGCDTF